MSPCTARQWIERYASAAGVDPPTEAQVGTLLDVAAAAAHGSERTAAPVTTWIAARAGLSPEQALAIATELQGDLGAPGTDGGS